MTKKQTSNCRTLRSKLEEGLISVASPIAKALIGKEGMSVSATPSGTKNYEILSIEVFKS